MGDKEYILRWVGLYVPGLIMLLTSLFQSGYWAWVLIFFGSVYGITSLMVLGEKKDV